MKMGLADMASSEESGEPSGPESMETMGQEAAGQELLDAIKAGDAREVAKAIKSMVMMVPQEG